MLIVVMVVAALIGVAYGATLLFPFWKFMRRSLDRSYDYRVDEPRIVPAKSKLLFDGVVIAGIISFGLGVTCWAVLSINDPATIFFLTVACVGLIVWAVFGRKY